MTPPPAPPPVIPPLRLLPRAGAAPAAPEPEPDPPGLRALDDPAALRAAVFDRVLGAAAALPPTSHDGHTLALADPHYADDPEPDPAAEKAAVLAGRTLGRRLRGTWVLTGPGGAEVARRTALVARVPWVTPRGTFVHNGSDYVVKSQVRLRPGVYVRRTADGRAEAHVNAAAHEGVAHRYRLDPATGRFAVAVGQAELPLLPLLRALGTTDDELREHWGDALLAANRDRDDPGTLPRLAERLVRKQDQTPDALRDPKAALLSALGKIRLDPVVARRTLAGADHPTLSKAAILRATARVAALARDEDEEDDRDHLAYQTVMGPEDLFAERLTLDHGRVRRELVRQATRTGGLDRLPAGALTRQIEQVLTGSGLGQSLEESNPLDAVDKLNGVTRMGEGGMSDPQLAPAESRSVHPSQYGIIDPVRTPESEAAGLDLVFAAGARKAADGQVYARFHTPAGTPVWRSPAQLADAVVGFSDSLKPRRLPAGDRAEAETIRARPEAARTDEEREILAHVDGFDPLPPRVLALVRGRMTYAPREAVELVLPHHEDTFSAVGRLAPARSADKAQRMAMGGRMSLQALPLVAPEAPLVRTRLPDGTDPQAALGPRAGAVRSPRGGVVERADADAVAVRHADGTSTTHPLYAGLPLNRKTSLTQTAAVKPGDAVAPGGLVATSNFTDARGHLALGLNLRTGYLPWAGPANYEDAVVVSRSAAERLTARQTFQLGLGHPQAEATPVQRYAALFPGRYDKAALAPLGADGVVRVGQTVTKGQPLVLAAAERPLGGTRVLRRAGPAFADHTVTWDYDDPGVVTDVAAGPAGPVVVVRADRPSRVGDKLSGLHGDKGVIARVLPDDEMPVAADGKPLEYLVSPTGIVSRANPAQTIELVLSRVARKLGRPVTVPDFADEDDLADWARRLAAEHGVAASETVTDPRTGRQVRGVPVGERFVMKLHHQAEDKLQARDGGGYDSDGRPTRGGPGGCLHGDTPVLTPAGPRRVADLVAARAPHPVDTPAGPRPVADWFERWAVPAELVTVTLSDGSAVHLTRGHAVHRADGSRAAAADLRPGDRLG